MRTGCQGDNGGQENPRLRGPFPFHAHFPGRAGGLWRHRRGWVRGLGGTQRACTVVIPSFPKTDSSPLFALLHSSAAGYARSFSVVIVFLSAKPWFYPPTHTHPPPCTVGWSFLLLLWWKITTNVPFWRKPRQRNKQFQVKVTGTVSNKYWNEIK